MDGGGPAAELAVGGGAMRAEALGAGSGVETLGLCPLNP
jgi:hypothetical protein